MLVGRRYRLELSPGQADYAEHIASTCRAVWNAALEQRRIAAKQRHSERPTYASQCRELAVAKATQPWLAEAPSHCLQQTLRDLDRACREHGVRRVHWRSKRRSMPTFRFPDARRIGEPRRVNRRWGEVGLPKMGQVRFRWSRSIGGAIRNATVLREAGHWYVAFCVDDGQDEAVPNGLPPVGIDCGVVVPVATSEGECLDFQSIRSGEAIRLRRLQQRLARQKKGSRRRRQTVRSIGRLQQRVRARRADFAHQTAHYLTTAHGIVVLEDLRVQAMTASARGTLEQPGSHVRQKAGLNRSILDKAWGQLRTALEWHGRKNGCSVIAVPAAYTSQTCSVCGQMVAGSRESQAWFCCRACGVVEHADVNAARNIMAAGLAVTVRGALAVGRAVKREPPGREVAGVTTTLSGSPLALATGRRSTHRPLGPVMPADPQPPSFTIRKSPARTRQGELEWMEQA
jgi:IS605 OrfB family transposase